MSNGLAELSGCWDGWFWSRLGRRKIALFWWISQFLHSLTEASLHGSRWAQSVMVFSLTYSVEGLLHVEFFFWQTQDGDWQDSDFILLDLFSRIALETLDVTPHLHQMSPVKVTRSNNDRSRGSSLSPKQKWLKRYKMIWINNVY